MRYSEIVTEAIDITSPDFQRWFGQSKVVDAMGRPVVVYHGTGGDFDAFNTSGGKGKTFGTGAFFSSNPATASTYAPGDGGNLKPVYLSLQHPAILDAGKENWNRIGKRARVDLPAVTVSDQADEDLLADLFDRPATPNAMKKLKARSTTLGRLFPDEMRYVDDFMSTDDMARWAKSQGYDGLIIRNVADHGPSGMHSTSDARKPSDLYVAFRPEQIKSAVGNTGAFDPRNPSIVESEVVTEARWKTPPLL